MKRVRGLSNSIKMNAIGVSMTTWFRNTIAVARKEEEEKKSSNELRSIIATSSSVLADCIIANRN